jgi:RNA-binding protein
VAKKRKPAAPPAPLTGKQKSHLRALAHKLKPVVQLGHQGLTEGVLTALDVALEKHELIKLKVAGDAEVDAAEIVPAIEKAARCQVAQLIGHTLVIYRRRERDPKIVLPRVKPAKVAASTLGPRRNPHHEDDEDDFTADDLEDGDVADDDDDLE